MREPEPSEPGLRSRDPDRTLPTEPNAALTTEVGADERPAARSPARDDLRRIGRYVILSKLGQGGMGVVYAAYDERLDRKVAVKLLHARPGSDAQQRLVREAQALARLSHPSRLKTISSPRARLKSRRPFERPDLRGGLASLHVMHIAGRYAAAPRVASRIEHCCGRKKWSQQAIVHAAVDICSA